MSAVENLVLAHQGGWDEALFVLVSIAIFGVLVVVANRRNPDDSNAEVDADDDQ